MNLIPIEIKENIIHNLGACDLGRAAQVCTEWNAIVYGRMWRGVFPKMIREETRFPANFPVKEIVIPTFASLQRSGGGYGLLEKNSVYFYTCKFLGFGSGFKTSITKYDVLEGQITESEQTGMFIYSSDSDGKTIVIGCDRGVYKKDLKNDQKLELLWEENREHRTILTIKVKDDIVAWVQRRWNIPNELHIHNLASKQHRTIPINTPWLCGEKLLINSAGDVCYLRSHNDEMHCTQYSSKEESYCIYGTYSKLKVCYLPDNELFSFGKFSDVGRMAIEKLMDPNNESPLEGFWPDEKPEAIEPLGNNRIAVLTMKPESNTLLLRIIDIFEKKVLWTKKISEGLEFTSVKLHATAGKILAAIESRLIIYHFN